MANDNHDIPIRRLAELLRNRMGSKEDTAGVFPFADTSSSELPFWRQLEHFRIFSDAVRWLRALGRSTMPGVIVGEEALPSNPRNLNLIFSSDEVSEALRAAWARHRKRERASSRLFTPGGPVIEMELDEATKTFTDGLANAIKVVPLTASTGLVPFTVNSTKDKYRVHVTDRYWYSPVVFGSRLSTPVDDKLYPGTYRFGGDKGGSIIWDLGTHTASPTHTSTTVTRF